jgi:uncharacterized protein (TIGR03790 family)
LRIRGFIGTIKKPMLLLILLLAALPILHAQNGQQVLLVVNGSDADSRQVGDYYRSRRPVPLKNVCTLQSRAGEEIAWETYVVQIERPIAGCLEKNGLREKILYIVLTMGIPLKIQGAGSHMTAEYGSVDSELALLYSKMKGKTFARQGPIPNPFFMQRDAPFQHPQFPIYLVTRLAAYDLAGVKAMIDRSLTAHNRGKFVIDGTGPNGEGNRWLQTAAMLLPRERVVSDGAAKVLYDQKDVIGYASWGSNDDNRKRRWLGFQWLPGAIATEFVSTNARTLKRPPDDWTLTTYEDRRHFFAGSPQSLTADLIQEGATGASGNTYEPFLIGCVRPDYLLPAYYQGRNLAESYYLALPFLSWQGVVLGDPLCSLGKP